MIEIHTVVEVGLNLIKRTAKFGVLCDEGNSLRIFLRYFPIKKCQFYLIASQIVTVLKVKCITSMI